MAVLEQMFDQVRSEPGTLVYVMHRTESEPDVIIFYELYGHQRDFDAHTSTEVHEQVVVSLEALLAKPMELHFLDAVMWKIDGTLGNAWGEGASA